MCEQAVGIDLGTTYSVVAHLDDTGRPVTVPNAEGELTTPSVVLFDGDEVVVGREAVRALYRETNWVAECAKRDVGFKKVHKVIGGTAYPPEVIEAIVLKKLTNDASAQIGEIRRAVITVPAYFDDIRRKATQDAGYIAGLDLLDIIDEPTAAALATGVRRGYLSPTGEGCQTQTLLVYDLGGGTFDVTVMRIDGAKFTTLAIDGDVRLGGRDWDQRLVDYVATEFAGQYGFDPRTDAALAGRLWHECEQAKRTLSARRKTLIACDFRGRSLPIEITREFFEELTSDLLYRTEYTTCEVLKAAGLLWGAIDRVLVVGGSRRMPMVVDMLRRLSAKEPDTSVSPDEAVAHGAAIRSGCLLRTGRRVPVRITLDNVNAHSLGVVGVNPLSGQKENCTIIPRNTKLPAKRKRLFCTRNENQRSISVQIVEGESHVPNQCSSVGRCVVPDLPPYLPAKTPVEVTFSYGTNARLSVIVDVPSVQRRISHQIVRHNNLTDTQRERWRRWLLNGRDHTDVR